jgi:riboflavin synthase
MFSGIIEATGKIARAESRGGGVRLVVRVPGNLAGLAPGSSLAVNGTCLTVVEAAGDTLAFDAVGATMDRTLLGSLRSGARVNLERSLRLGSPVDGHLVTGHVDGVGTVVSRRPGEGAVWFGIEVPEELVPQIAPRGSVAVDGVSLTVASVRGRAFEVSIVPYTLDGTLFGEYAPGRRVHLETDVLAKYVQRALSKEEGTSLASLFPETRREI